MRRLAQGHHDTQLGGAGDRTSNLAVTSQPALPPELTPPSVREWVREWVPVKRFYPKRFYPKRFYPKRFTVLTDIHPFTHTFTHRRRSQPRRATASWSGAVRVRRLCSGTPRRSARRSRGSNQQPCGYQPLYLLS